MKDQRKFQTAMSYLGDDLIQEAMTLSAAKPKEKKSVWLSRKALAIAAMLLVAIGAGVFSFLLLRSDDQPILPAGSVIFTAEEYRSDAYADLPASLQQLKIEADGTSSRMISADTTLTIETSGACDVNTLTQYVSLTPSIPLDVTQVSDCCFTVKPASGTFGSGLVYRLSVGNPENPAASYAFQTASELVIKSILPADEGLDVPIDTGIEICFSEAVTAEEVDSHFSISPSVKGEYYVYPDGRTVAFVPKKTLALDTIYEVTVKAGIKGQNGKPLQEGKTVRFRTVASNKTDEDAMLVLSFNNDLDDGTCYLQPGESKALRLLAEGYNIKDLGIANVKIYRFASAKDMAEMLRKRESHAGDDQGLDLSKAVLVEEKHPGFVKLSGLVGYSRYLSAQAEFEVNNYAPGVYCVVVDCAAKTNNGEVIRESAFGFFQVTPLRTFVISSDGKTLLWVTYTDGMPVAGADVEGFVYNRKSGWNLDEATEITSIKTQTGADGTLLLETEGNNGAVLVITSGEETVLCCAQVAEEEQNNYYFSYLYTDREVYFANDLVNFEGVLKAAYAGASMPTELYLKSGYSARKTLLQWNDGVFSGSLPIENMTAGGFYLKIVDADDRVYVSKYIRVTEEEKPMIKAEITFDRLAYRYGDKVTATLTASFFDGKPASGFQFVFSLNPYFEGYWCNSTETDENGQIRLTFNAGKMDYVTTDARTISLRAELAGKETQRLVVYAETWYFPSDYVFAYEYQEEGLLLTLNKRDLSKIVTEEDLTYPLFPANTVGSIATGKIHYRLIKNTIVRESQTTYDTYLKRNVTYYSSYVQQENVVEKTVTFADGKIILPTYEVKENGVWYTYEISFDDGRNPLSYHLSGNRYATSNWSETSDYRYQLRLNTAQYRVNDPLKAVLYADGEQAENALYVLIGNGIETYVYGEQLTTLFRESMIPGASVYAVVYDVAQAQFHWETLKVPYDRASSEMKLEVVSDKEVYRPGEQAVLSISAEGCHGGTVLVSLVDEACFALGEQDIDLLSLFLSSASGAQTYDWYGYYQKSSLKPVLVDWRLSLVDIVKMSRPYTYSNTAKGVPGRTETIDKSNLAEAPESDSSKNSSIYLREYFADNPVFMAVTLDENGKGTLVCQVPDNMTSWRITSCGFFDGGNLTSVKIGQCISDVICTLPFYLVENDNSQYLTEDDLIVSARCYGQNNLPSVDYTAYLYAEDGEILQTLACTPKAKTQAVFNFGKRPVGHYSVAVYAVSSAGSDGVKTEIDVVPSSATLRVEKEIHPEELASLQIQYYPVTLTFYQKNSMNELYNRVLESLLYSDGSGRSDRLLAQYVATMVKGATYGVNVDEALAQMQEKLSHYRNYSLLSYSERDLELTARMLAVWPYLMSQTGKNSLLALYYDQLGEKQIDDVSLTSTLLGLAALDEPVLDTLYAVANQASNFSVEAKLYLAASFATLGDYGASQNILNALIKEQGVLDEEFGTLYFKAETLSERIRLSSLALLSASRVSKSTAECLARFLVTNQVGDESNCLALACYLRFLMPSENIQPSKITYSFDGEEAKTVNVRFPETVSLRLSKADLEHLTIESMDEDVGIRISYLGEMEEALNPADESSRFQLTKTIVEEGNNRYMVTLTLSGSSCRRYECFDLTDYIPSGARLLTLGNRGLASCHFASDKTVDCYGSIYSGNGQKMLGYISLYVREKDSKDRREYSLVLDKPYEFEVSVSYVIRGALEGEFVVEPAVALNTISNRFALSEKTTLMIK